MRNLWLLLAVMFTLVSFDKRVGADEHLIAVDPGEQSQIQEFVVIVSDLDLTLPAFTDVLKWEIKHEGMTDKTIAQSWGMPVATPIHEVLVGNAASNYGFVRLAEIEGVDQDLIRPGARWWDVGGILNINVLVKNSEDIVKGLRALGWYARAQPEVYVYPGNVKGVSMIMIGPDDLMLSFQERQSPPLSGWPSFDGGTHIEVGIRNRQGPGRVDDILQRCCWVLDSRPQHPRRQYGQRYRPQRFWPAPQCPGFGLQRSRRCQTP